MNKILTVLICLIMIGSLVIACNNSSPLVASDSEELTSVTFEDSGAVKSLAAEVSGMGSTIDDSYWFYTAVKTDGGPATGKTSADNKHKVADQVPVQRKSTDPTSADYNKAEKGLTGKVATGFSVGEWTFRLYGYNNADGKTTGTTESVNNAATFNSPWPDQESSAYTKKGASATLKQGFVTKVSVPVEPAGLTLASSGNAGKLVISPISAPEGTYGEAKMKYRYSLGTKDSDTGNVTSWGSWNTWTEFSSQVEITTIECPYVKVEIGAFYPLNKTGDAAYPDNPQLSETIMVMLYQTSGGVKTTISGSLDNIQSGISFDSSTGTVVQVKYDANGANTGNVPVDENGYKPGNPVTVLRNEGNLVKDGYIFAGWNTKADGSGTSYQPNDTFPAEDITLYAVWAVVTELPKVGGTIYYMVETADGYNSYRFFKESGEEITAAQNNNNIRGGYFADAYYVLETGKSGNDKFYVFDSRKNGDSYIGLVSGKEWGAKGTNVGINTDGIGKGKTNTETALGYAAAHPNTHPNPFDSGTSPDYGTNTIWTWIRDVRDSSKAGTEEGKSGNTTGLYDWFIPSKEELNQLKTYTGYNKDASPTPGTNPGTPSWFDTSSIWSSVESDGNNACYWNYSRKCWWVNYTAKNNTYAVVAVRAF